MRADCLRIAAALFASVLVSSCGSDSPNNSTANTVFKTASLNGAQETPAVTSVAPGSAFSTVDTSSGAISGTVNPSTIDGTLAHIHEGPVGTAAPVIVPLAKGAGGIWTVPDSTMLTPSQIDSLRNGNLYVNVHTTANPNGEIRGQIGRTVYFATLTPAQETPPTTSTASGPGAFIL